MFEPEEAETTGLRRCDACGAEQVDRDKFCRRCGASQTRNVCQSMGVAGNVVRGVACEVSGVADRSGCETGPLSGSGTLRRSFSGPLVSLVAQKLSEDASSLTAHRWMKFLVSMIVAVPLWLMIVMLSPFDAYAAAKELSKQG